MRVLEVIPISRGITSETLSYFTGSDISVGSIIKVPLRKRVIPALVISAKEVEDMKSEIKNSPFALKKVEKLKSFNLLSKEFIETCNSVSEYYIGSNGSVLSSIVPKILFENAENLRIPKENEPANPNPINAERFAIQSNDEDRYTHYKSIIREEFAKGYSVFFCLPTIQDIKKATEKLQKGIESYTFILHSSMSKKEIIESINKILEEKHPLLIVATGGFLSIPKQQISTIILDKENSRSYKTQTRPYIDIRNFAETFATKIKAKIIFGDLLLRAETIWRYKNGEIIEIAPLKFRSLTTSTQEIVDMKIKKEEIENTGQEKRETKREFKIFSESLENKIKESIENNEHLFIFTARRGLSPSTVCADCGNIVKCNSCGAHIVLHKSPAENFFLCHKCGERRSALEKCSNCNGWRLTTLGIGSEMVEEKVKELNPNCKIYRIDADTTPTHKKALLTAEKFYNSPQGILIGTEMALLYLTEKIENSAVVSMDSFFSIPDFRINERVLNILLKMRAITDRNLIIQTRDISQKVFDYAIRGNLIDFFKEEIEDRKILNYPPFSTLIKISISGTKKETMELVENLQKIIEPHEIDIFPAFIPQEKGKFGVNGIIKIKMGEWPSEGLSRKLKSLAPNFSVNVDPDGLI
ncbi:MAG: primosomal protein N' [Candidatus Pacebacteria bacterium]|nr:primosomal protein N' [Candidatus Paceibacterota bacterium]